MMPGNVCMHDSGEFCVLCFTPGNPAWTQPTEVEMLRIRVSALEKTLHELLDKIAEIANWCYREK